MAFWTLDTKVNAVSACHDTYLAVFVGKALRTYVALATDLGM